MAKPVIKGSDPTLVTVEASWLLEFANAIDRESYSCRGIFTCTDGPEAMRKKINKFVEMDAEDLKKQAK